MTTQPLTDQLQQALRFARELSDETGRMRDPYETEYGENFAPACFSVVAAARFRLLRQPEDLEWAWRWGRRSAAIMRESPYLREYMLGYAAIVLGLLEPSPQREALRQELCAASLPEEPLSTLGHILALQLVGDLLCPRGPASGSRAETIVAELEQWWTPAGFPEDRREGDDGSIPHAYLTVATLAIFLVVRPANEAAQRLQPRIVALIARACDWFHRANGPAMCAAQANRSYNQLWTYPLHALVAFVHRGARAGADVARCLERVQRASNRRRRGNFLPTAMSPFASAGNEPYNRVNNDVGAGGVGWALLAILQAADFPGLAGAATDLPASFDDAPAGYAFFHGAATGVVLPTRQHRWRYHLPLQPAWLVVGGSEVPFVGAKRAGVNHPYAAHCSDLSRLSPWLEPYFGVMAAGPEGVAHVMQEPVTKGGDHEWTGALAPEGKAAASAARVTVKVATGRDSVVLTYHLQGELPGEAWLGVPILLWDGEHELEYVIKGAAAELAWAGRGYALSAATVAPGPGPLPGSWLLRRERFLHTGFGVTGNLAIALGTARAVQVTLAVRENTR